MFICVRILLFDGKAGEQEDGVAWCFGRERGIGTGEGHVEVRADEELELPQVGTQGRHRLVGGGFPGQVAFGRVCPAQFDLACRADVADPGDFTVGSHQPAAPVVLPAESPNRSKLAQLG
jgi:hypothetical protein